MKKDSKIEKIKLGASNPDKSAFRTPKGAPGRSWMLRGWEPLVDLEPPRRDPKIAKIRQNR